MKRKGNKEKREMYPAFYGESVFTWRKKIAELVFKDKIPNDLILNFDHRVLHFANPSKIPYAKLIGMELIYTETTDLISKREIFFKV